MTSLITYQDISKYEMQALIIEKVHKKRTVVAHFHPHLLKIGKFSGRFLSISSVILHTSLVVHHKDFIKHYEAWDWE